MKMMEIHQEEDYQQQIEQYLKELEKQRQKEVEEKRIAMELREQQTMKIQQGGMIDRIQQQNVIQDEERSSIIQQGDRERSDRKVRPRSKESQSVVKKNTSNIEMILKDVLKMIVVFSYDYYQYPNNMDGLFYRVVYEEGALKYIVQDVKDDMEQDKEITKKMQLNIDADMFQFKKMQYFSMKIDNPFFIQWRGVWLDLRGSIMYNKQEQYLIVSFVIYGPNMVHKERFENDEQTLKDLSVLQQYADLIKPIDLWQEMIDDQMYKTLDDTLWCKKVGFYGKTQEWLDQAEESILKDVDAVARQGLSYKIKDAFFKGSNIIIYRRLKEEGERRFHLQLTTWKSVKKRYNQQLTHYVLISKKMEDNYDLLCVDELSGQIFQNLQRISAQGKSIIQIKTRITAWAKAMDLWKTKCQRN